MIPQKITTAAHAIVDVAQSISLYLLPIVADSRGYLEGGVV